MAAQKNKNVSVTMVRKLKSPADAVFAAWTQPRLIARWLANGADTVTSISIDLKKGGHFRLEGLNGDGEPYTYSGTYLDLIEDRRVALSWIYDGPVPALRSDSSVVIAEIRELDADLTELTLTHERLTGRDEAELYRVSWIECMGKLENVAACDAVSATSAERDRSDFYTDSQRRMQDRFATRKLADRLESVLIHDHLSAVDAAFITRQNMVFVATADAYGQPSCSYKGGTRGFVTVLDERTLAFPDYNGNGMHLSVGNIDETSKISLLFVDFERQARMRVLGTARVSADDPMRNRYPGSERIVRVTIESVFTNCPRYLHKMKLVEESDFVPSADVNAPDPAWKRLSAVADVLHEDDKHLAGLDTNLDKTLNKD